MRLSQRAGVYLSAVILNTALLVFGAILILQGAVHKMVTGEAEVRDLVVERATEPVSFWYSVGFDAIVGAALVAGGIYGLWLTFKPKPSSDGGDDAD